MISTERWPHIASTQTVPDDPFEQLRAAFQVRLQSDAVRLAVLAAALARADADSASNFEDIRLFAHRVRGAAALFGAADIASVADALEQTAISAAHARAENSDTSIWTALEALAERLAAVNGKTIPAAPAAARWIQPGVAAEVAPALPRQAFPRQRS
jgi:HPt (histidine-containing phosphotransfer) domain-containing protein